VPPTFQIKIATNARPTPIPCASPVKYFSPW
jgi:hypothetical protein